MTQDPFFHLPHGILRPPCLIADGALGRKLILTDRWNDECYDMCVSEAIREIELVSTFGWSAPNLDFLQGIAADQILGLRVCDWGRDASQEPLEDDSGLTCLTSLRYLNLQTHCKNPVDFSHLPDLRDCQVDWHPRIASLLDADGLCKLIVSGIRVRDLEQLFTLRTLRSLSIIQCPVHQLKGIERLDQLESLDLALLTKLTSLEGLSALAKLRHLELSSCKKFRDLDPLSHTHLQQLYLIDDGHIASLRPLTEIRSLEELFFYGETIVDDGDIAVLEQMPQLRSVRFGNRRTYNRTLESVRDFIREKRVSNGYGAFVNIGYARQSW